MKRKILICFLLILCVFSFVLMTGCGDDKSKQKVSLSDTVENADEYNYRLNIGGTSYFLYSYKGTSSIVEIPATYNELPVVAIGDYAFMDNAYLDAIKLPQSVTKIGAGAFSGCISLDNFVVSDSVKELGKAVFENCTSLDEVTLGKGISSVSDELFYGCNSLDNVNFKGKIATIGSYSFYDCLLMEKFTIPDTVTSIGESAFMGCKSITEFEIPDSVTSIGNLAFSSCDSLLSLKISENSSIENTQAFKSCENVDSVTAPASFIKLLPQNNLKEITINNGTEIEAQAFENFASLETVTLGKTVVTINEDAFKGCLSLVEIKLGNVKCIKSGAFDGCKNLFSITLTNTIEQIESGAFENCFIYEIYNLSNLTITNNVTINGGIGRFALDIYTDSEALSKLSIEADCLLRTDGEVVSLVKYLGDENEIVLSSEITEILTLAFSNNVSLTSLDVPSSVTKINADAFSGCLDLNMLKFADGVICTVNNNIIDISNSQTNATNIKGVFSAYAWVLILSNND